MDIVEIVATLSNAPFYAVLLWLLIREQNEHRETIIRHDAERDKWLTRGVEILHTENLTKNRE